MGHPIKDREKGLKSWNRAIKLARYNRRCTCCLKPAMSASEFCGPCWQKDRFRAFARRVSTFALGSGRLGIVEHSPRNPPFVARMPLGFLRFGEEVSEGFTVPAGFAALGE